MTIAGSDAAACDTVFPERKGWFTEYYEELRGWSEVPAAFRSWAELEEKAAALRVWKPGIMHEDPPDVWFIVDGTAGGSAPQGQYFFEVNSGGGTRVIPFSVPGDALPVPAGQAPVITMNGAVWTRDPASGPGTLVEVMPKN